MIRNITISALLGFSAASFATEPVFLTCDYPADMGRPSAQEIGLVPHELIVDHEAQAVTWSGRRLTAKVSETEIVFETAGFQYTISRISGAIRFFSPQGLADWRRIEADIMRAAALRGGGLEDAQLKIASAAETRVFRFREHTGQCSIARKTLF